MSLSFLHYALAGPALGGLGPDHWDQAAATPVPCICSPLRFRVRPSMRLRASGRASLCTSSDPHLVFLDRLQSVLRFQCCSCVLFALNTLHGESQRVCRSATQSQACNPPGCGTRPVLAQAALAFLHGGPKVTQVTNSLSLFIYRCSKSPIALFSRAQRRGRERITCLTFLSTQRLTLTCWL